MKRHSEIGADLLSSIKFPYPVVPIVRHHHEHWNGGGYPSGIAGADIPLGARILSVVDCYDALTSDRPYRPRLTDGEAFEIIRQRRGTMYDPLVVDTFVRVHPEIAPMATQAGQEARTMLDASGPNDQASIGANTPLTRIRSTAFESTLISGLQRRLSTMQATHEVLSELANVLRQITPARVYALYRYNVQSDVLVCEHVVGDDDDLVLGMTINVGERVTGWAAASQHTSLNSDAYLDLGPVAEMIKPPLRSMISIPLIVNGAVLAVLSAYSAKHQAFNEEHQYIFEHAALLAAERLSLRTTVKSKNNKNRSGTLVAFR
jgi:putative methionine-R-sulfoxide reductase with GAF domain